MPGIIFPTKTKFDQVVVFCGSCSGKRSSYAAAASIKLAQELIVKRIDLVYGGGGIGQMGLASQTMLEGDRHAKYHAQELFGR